MVDTSSLAGVMRASQRPRRTAMRQTEPRPTPQPTQPGFQVPENRRSVQGLGNALAGTVLGALDVPVQAIGGMHRDVISGERSRGQSAGSRAVQDYGQNVGRLWSDFLMPSEDAPSPFLPREFDAASEAAIDRFGLEGGAASAARGAGFAADLLTGLAVGGAGSKAGQGARVVADDVSHLARSVSSPEAYYSSLLRRIMDDPDTALSTVRSMNSADDIIAGSGVFRSSRDLGTSGAHGGAQVSDMYNPLRDVFESNMGMGSDTVYGALTSPVLRNQRAPFPLGSRGRENFLNYQKTARMMDPYETALSYGSGGDRIPVRYMLGDDALQRSGITFGDSLRGAPAFDSYDDFVAAVNRGGYNEIMSTPGRANWGWGSSSKGGLNIPEYIEAQIPGATIDDVTRIIGSGRDPRQAAERSMDIADIVARSGRDIPVEALSQQVPVAPKVGRELVDTLMSRPDYRNISASLRDQRAGFVPSGMDDIVNRGYEAGGAYQRPDWAVGHVLREMGENSSNHPYSAVAQSLRGQINPRLNSMYRFLFPEAVIPNQPPNPFGRIRTLGEPAL